MDFAKLFTSTEGRIGRKSFWIGIVVFIVVAILVSVIIVLPLGGMMSTGGRLIMFILALIFAYPYYCLGGKRFQDRNKPASLALIGVVYSVLKSLLDLIGLTGNPMQMGALDYVFGLVGIVIGLWFLVELGFLRGTVGTNQYGPDPVGAM